ncbi:MAG: hypothetical protein WCR30_02770 [Clostridia bacterium]
MNKLFKNEIFNYWVDFARFSCGPEGIVIANFFESLPKNILEEIDKINFVDNNSCFCSTNKIMPFILKKLKDRIEITKLLDTNDQEKKEILYFQPLIKPVKQDGQEQPVLHFYRKSGTFNNEFVNIDITAYENRFAVETMDCCCVADRVGNDFVINQQKLEHAQKKGFDNNDIHFGRIVRYNQTKVFHFKIENLYFKIVNDYIAKSNKLFGKKFN